MADNEQNARLTEVYNAYHRDLLRYVIGQFAFDVLQAEDVVHQAFEKFSQGQQDKVIAEPKSYLKKMVRNIALDILRRNKHRDSYRNHITHMPVDDQVHDPLRVHLAKQSLDIMLKTIEGMPEQRRKYLLRSRFDNVSNVAIAKEAGISESAVRKHIARALVDIKLAIDSASSEGSIDG